MNLDLRNAKDHRCRLCGHRYQRPIFLRHRHQHSSRQQANRRHDCFLRVHVPIISYRGEDCQYQYLIRPIIDAYATANGNETDSSTQQSCMKWMRRFVDGCAKRKAFHDRLTNLISRTIDTYNLPPAEALSLHPLQMTL